MRAANRPRSQLFGFFLRLLPFPMMKPWRKFLLAAVVCGSVGCVTIFVVSRPHVIAQGGDSSVQNILQEDRNFLDELVQKKDQDNRHDRSSLSAADQNSGKAGAMVESPKPVPRAELVINTEIVRRGELVFPRRTLNSSVRPSRPNLQPTILRKP
jgi:hypothetical protein